MRQIRWAATAALTALVATGLAAVPADAADAGYPTGTFHILHGPVEYLWDRASDHSGPSAQFAVYRSALSDDETPPENLVVRLYAGTSLGNNTTNGAIWGIDVSSKALKYGSSFSDPDEPPLAMAGTYHPYVTITDEDGNTTTVQLGAVTLVEDHTPPVVKLKPPAREVRTTIRAWRHVWGTAIDGGISRPYGPFALLPHTEVLLIQKRGRYFYVYNSRNQRWARGARTLRATVSTAKVSATGFSSRRTDWRTRYVHGLRKGLLVVLAKSWDTNENETPWTPLARVTLTRRR